MLQHDVDAATSTGCLADAVHRVMGVEAQERFGLTTGAMTWLQRHPERIRELSAFREAARQLSLLPVRLLAADARLMDETADVSSQHGLLTNDATIIALMRRHNIANLLTNDNDFDRVPAISLWKPR